VSPGSSILQAKGIIMPDKTDLPTQITGAPGAAPAKPAAKTPIQPKPGFDPAALRGGKGGAGKGFAPGGGKRMQIPGKSRGR